MTTFAPRRAISLIELLVVIAIIAALLAFLLPAVQKARAAAALTKCQNNLRQTALALHAYHTAKEHLPPGDANTGKHGTWAVATLPYVGEDALFRVYQNFGGPAASGVDQPTYDREPNLQIATKRLGVLTCPADAPNAVRYKVDSDIHLMPAHNYATCFGNTTRSRNTVDDISYGGSAFTYGGECTKLSDITDGTANTLLLAEVRQGPSGNDRRGLIWWGPGTSLTTFQTPNSSAPDEFQTKFDCVTDVPELPCQIAVYVVVTSRSRHTGGVNAAMADGSVRFVSNTVARPVWQAVGTTKGGEPVQDL